MVKRLSVNIGARRAGGKATTAFPSSAQYYSEMKASSAAMMQKLLAVIDAMEEASPEIIMEALEPTKALAEYYCPHDTGKLEESAYLEVTSFRGKPRVELGFAKGNDPHYAALVHERPIPHAAPTSYKFLQRAIDEDAENVFARIVAGYQEIFR